MSSVSMTELHQLQDEEEKEEERRVAYPSHEYYKGSGRSSSSSSTSVWEIEEEEEEKSENDWRAREVNRGRTGLGTIQEESTMDHIIIGGSVSSSSSSLFSFDVHNNNNNNNDIYNKKGEEDDCVYVGIGGGGGGGGGGGRNKDDEEHSSLEALSWTLNHLINIVPTTTNTVCLIHVFPQIHHIPSPLGKLPKSQVSPEQVESYMAQERGKRREFLQKFLNMCTASKVKVDTVLIESDLVAKAFLDLIPILNIRKLVLGTTKSGLRRSKTKRGGGVIDQILEKAPEYCEIKVICQGKEVKDQITNGSPSPSGVADHVGENTKSTNESFACICFKSPRVM